METDGGGWAVFQRREDGSVNFLRGRMEYKKGFGDLDKEFWLGLDKISRLTKSPQELRVDLSDFYGKSRYAQYETFQVGNEESGYVLKVGSYFGDAGDSLIPMHNEQPFSTIDSGPMQECAVRHKGAWWYNNCYYSNLNGKYYSKVPIGSEADGVAWSKWKGDRDSLKFTEMKVRPN